MIDFLTWFISPVGILVLVFVVAFMMGIPIAVAMGLASIASLLVCGDGLEVLAQVTYTAADNFALIAIPMFILAGNLMLRGGITKRITDFCDILVGNFAGGIGGVTVLGCVFFSALSGSGPAVTAAIGTIMIPTMIKTGYEDAYAGAICACSGGIGIVIPPSIPIIIYGLTASVSIGKLFIAGIIPGFLLGIGLYAVNYITSKRNNYRGTKRDRSKKAVLKAIYDAKWAFGAPVVVLGGIYSGVFSVTEASVAAVIYAVLVGTFIFKELNLNEIFFAVKETVRLIGPIFLIIGTATLFGRILTLNQVSQIMAEAIMKVSTDPTVVMCLIAFLLLFIGMWMETIAQVMILTPIFLPMINELGIDPVFFGIVFIIACEVGFETPPLGANLYVATELVDTTFEKMSLRSLPFALVEIAVMFLLIMVPHLVTFLPRFY